MTGAEKDTLIALVEQGPLWDGDVPSKHGRDLLLAFLHVMVPIAAVLRRAP